MEFSKTTGQTITCRAAIAWEPNRPLDITEVEVAPPKAGEVRAKVLSNALCHTDVYTLGGEDPEGLFPCILGHEASAVVESIGDGVTSVKPGDWIIPCYTPQCMLNDCKFCQSDDSNLCPRIRNTQGKGVMPDGTSRFSKNGRTIYHFMGCSTLSEYTVLAEISCAKVSAMSNSKETCLLGCGIATGWGAVDNTTKVSPGSSVAVFGLGALGLSVIQRAKERGAGRIVGIDLNEGKFEIARRFGASECVLSDGNIRENLLKLEEWGFDYTFDCTGNVNVMRIALESAHRGWGMSCIIGVAAAGKEISARPFQLITGRKWVGTAFGGWKSRAEVPELVQSIMRKEYSISEFVTHEFNGIVDTNLSIDALHSGTCLRAVVHMVTDEERNQLRESSADPYSSPDLELVDKQKVHGGYLMRFRHTAPSINNQKMTFSIFLPSKAERQSAPPPVLFFLGGIECSDENGRLKANVFPYAAKYGYAVVFPDTSPRDSGIPGENDDWMVGLAASYYLDATKKPYAGIYNMESYLTKDLPTVLRDYFTVDLDRAGITGFSMGGHGAISLHLKHPDIFRSCSAFAPICSLENSVIGKKCIDKLLAQGTEEAEQHQITSLLRLKPSQVEILVDQGSKDNFIGEHLRWKELAMCQRESDQRLTLNLRDGYGHNFYFVSTFIENHIEHHARTISQSIQRRPE